MALVLNNSSLHFRVFVKRSHLELWDYKVTLNYLIFLIRRQRWLKTPFGMLVSAKS